MQRNRRRLSEPPDYGSALNKFIAVAGGKENYEIPIKPKLDTSKINLPNIKIDLAPDTKKVIDTGIKILSAAIVIHGIAMVIKR
jgi:hypothetical protein